MIALFFFLTALGVVLLLVVVELYTIRTNQQAYFKKSTEDWNELITAIKELGRSQNERLGNASINARVEASDR